MTYYDTTAVSERDRKKYAHAALRQDDSILQVFRQSENPLTPSEVHSLLYLGSTTPLTSVRRSITNLTNKGMLRKSGQKKIGMYGRPEHVWEISGA